MSDKVSDGVFRALMVMLACFSVGWYFRSIMLGLALAAILLLVDEWVG